MLENFIFITLILIEIGVAVVGITYRKNFKKEKAIIHVGLFTLFILLVMIGVIHYGFTWYGLSILLLIQAIYGAYVLLAKKENPTRKIHKTVFITLSRIILIFFLLITALLLPQYSPLATSGEYKVGTISYTITDTGRDETYTEVQDHRRVTMQFWYPTNENGELLDQKFPLVIFSHGAFGYRMSNYSTYQELATNGYVVVSIDHTYHAIFTDEVDGESIIVNMDFINSAIGATNGDIVGQELFDLYQEWMKVRMGDMHFVVNHIQEKVQSLSQEAPYASIDMNHVGVMGHSMGGATAAQIGRESELVDAVIVLDGTMLGEIVGFENNKDVLNDQIYDKPILNVYAEDHYNNAKTVEAEYPNLVVHNTATDSYQVVMQDTGHLNFTDLPIVSPILAGMLGVGNADARYAIEKTNDIVLEFFNHYLKSDSSPIEKDRVF